MELDVLKRYAELICRTLKIQLNIPIEIVQESNVPFFTGNKIVLVNVGQNWNLIYQLAHELTHYAFRVYSEKQNLPNSLWIEEIVCESFSIFCLMRFSFSEFPQWKGYCVPNFYIQNGNTIIIDKPETISDLNKLLSGYKTYETRQLVHPTALKIVEEIRKNHESILAILDLRNFVTNGLITKNINNITAIIRSFQENVINHQWGKTQQF